MNFIQIFILVILVLVIGISLGRMASIIFYTQEEMKVEQHAKLIIQNASIEAANMHLEAKQQYIQNKTEFENEISKKKKFIEELENNLKTKEKKIIEDLEQANRRNMALDKIRTELNELKDERILKLQKIVNISLADAKKQLMAELEDEVKFNSATKMRAIIAEANSNAAKEAKQIILTTIQRIAAEQTVENTSMSIHLDDDTLKGKIIGKDGRNIKSLEAVTGVDIIVDETPKTILLSSFDAVKREIARLTIQELLQDGRVHPGRIEEVYAKVESTINSEILATGERTVLDLGIYGIHNDLIKLIGRMSYRTSYSQNLLKHSIEVSNLSSVMATEMGLDAKLAKRAGLLHDIGKVSNKNPELTHAILGMGIAKECGEHPDVCNAIGAHHDEIEMTVLISPVIQACDAISGARPGARKEVLAVYTKRLKDMETLGLSFDGVKQCYAIQAGRELRVIVDSSRVTDKGADELVFDLSRKIESHFQYPGHVKVVVIREKRAVDFAK